MNAETCIICAGPIEEGEPTKDIHYRGEKMGEACSICKSEFI